MANRERGEVQFDVNGKAYTLRLDANALAEMEGALSTDTKQVTFQQALTLVERRQVLALRALLWASLRRHHKNMTLEDAGDLMQEMGGVVGIEKKLQEAIAVAMPNGQDAVANPQQARRHGRGARSTSGPGA